MAGSSASPASAGEAFTSAYGTLWPAAVSAARGVLRNPATAEDVAQDVFVELWSHPERFDPDRSPLSTYVKVLARSRALDRARTDVARRKASDRLFDTYDRSTLVTPPCDEGTLGDPHSLAAALTELPREQRDAVLLAYAMGLTVAEIAERAGAPLGTAKSRVRLGLKKLRLAVATTTVEGR